MKKTSIELFLIYLFLFHESCLSAPLNQTTTESLTQSTETTPFEESTTEATSTKAPLGHDGVKMIKKKQLLSKEFHKLEEENSINYFPLETSTTTTTQKSTTATTEGSTSTSSSPSSRNMSRTTPQSPTMQSKISDINYEIIESASVSVTTSKPEPAAIEIHINVSESFGSESENVEFSLGPQPHHLQSLQGDDVTEENKIILGIESNQPIKAINSDDIFIPQIKLESIERDIKDKNNPAGTGAAGNSRDSDTIFYISNTEVKVGEDGNRYLKKKNGKEVSYIAESYIEVVESSASTTQLPTTTSTSTKISVPSVVIEPVPESVQISIGELPPQIELKEIDYMPSEEQQSIGDIKYGSDLIDEDNIKSFDSMYSGAGYPFGNGADSIKFNSMKKDEMAVSALEPNTYNDPSNSSSVISEEDPNYIRE